MTFFPYPRDFTFSNGIQQFIYASPFTFLFSGTSAVYVFFVLSGYILSVVALKPNASIQRIILMSLKRYPRLMLPTLASCIVAYFAFKLMNAKASELSAWIQAYGAFDFSFVGAVHSGTLGTFIGGSSEYNWVLWTMQIELIGSILIYLLCASKVLEKHVELSTVVLILLIGLTGSTAISLQLGLGLLAFYTGFALQQLAKPISTFQSILLVLISFYLAGIHHVNPAYNFLVKHLGVDTYYYSNALSGLVLVYATLFNARLNNLLSNKLLVWMGRLSFSAYLLHMPVLATAGVFSSNLVAKYSQSQSFSILLTSLVVITCTYGSSYFFYRCVDKKSMMLSGLFAHSAIAYSKHCLSLTKQSNNTRR